MEYIWFARIGFVLFSISIDFLQFQNLYFKVIIRKDLKYAKPNLLYDFIFRWFMMPQVILSNLFLFVQFIHTKNWIG